MNKGGGWKLNRVVEESGILTNSEYESEFNIKVSSIPDNQCPTYGMIKGLIPNFKLDDIFQERYWEGISKIFKGETSQYNAALIIREEESINSKMRFESGYGYVTLESGVRAGMYQTDSASGYDILHVYTNVDLGNRITAKRIKFTSTGATIKEFSGNRASTSGDWTYFYRIEMMADYPSSSTGY